MRPARVRVLVLLAVVSAAVAAAAATGPHPTGPETLAEAGSPGVQVWRVPAARSAVPSDPLAGDEYWRAAVRVDTLEPPGPGVPVTVVDSGVSFGHPEFNGRPNLIALDNQEPAPIGGVHGTAVASVVGAPENGVGVVGIYPQAVIRSWDASLGDGTRLPSRDIARGIVAAAQAGRSVINLSLGGTDPDRAIDVAVREAIRAGSLVVAASGNAGDEDNALSYPGANPHVLTVGATDQNDGPAIFTTRSPFVDLAAPGVNIPVASALDNSWQAEDGTSFSSPMVAGAAAWLWTVRPSLDASQVAEILRTSARDVWLPGYDDATGWGILDMTAALAAPTPLRDTPEPNDDTSSASVATTKTSPRRTIAGRVMAFEDPRDVYKVWQPARKALVVRVTSDGVGVTVGGVARTAKTFTLTVPARRAARTVFLTVKPQSGVRDAAYRLAVSA